MPLSSEPVLVGNVLQRVLKKLGLERKLREAKIAQDWAGIVGSKIAGHSKPTGVRGKVLFVNVDSSVWLSELNNFFKLEMLDQINKQLGEKRIKDIRFRIGEI